ncbi:hypothetical protein BJ875DRAFT_446899 [Amylocarpus encephaloides]|uniref:Uncharacterized protein n=1 Tax=Amylocarpus encephaloides TaxID=45428 RepID=A0A9P7Y7R3_9HELO|nr:hypothetical protein BJ875DRAFT_446899 [Amylocarpus encephaloides]
MGLPLFITPIEPEGAAKAAEKNAAGPRSAIRRQRTLRGSSARVHNLDRRRRIMPLAADPSPEEYEAWETQRLSPPSESELDTVASLQGLAQRTIEVEERMRSRDTPPIESRARLPDPPQRRTTPSEGSSRNTPNVASNGSSRMPPVPETRDYYSQGRGELSRLRAISDIQRLARNPAPTPPYTESDLAFLARVGSDGSRSSSLTTGVSMPRRQITDDADAPPRWSFASILSGGNGRSYNRRFALGSVSNSRTPRSNLSDRIVSASREIGGGPTSLERARPSARQSYDDGLGDRDRSLSPEGGGVWDTLLTSITPDPQPPSAGSSFASAVAATSSTSGSGPGSVNTSMTSTGPADETSTIRDCDASDSGSISGYEREDMYEMQGVGVGLARREWRSYAAVLTAEPDRASRNNASTDAEEIRGMHQIISRLADNSQIPDEWWASAGLSRNLRRDPMS